MTSYYKNHVVWQSVNKIQATLQMTGQAVTKKWFVNPILPWGGGVDAAPLTFFFHHPETAQAMKLKLSDFKDTCLRHILQVIPSCYILRCYHGNKITKGTLQNLTQ